MESSIQIDNALDVRTFVGLNDELRSWSHDMASYEGENVFFQVCDTRDVLYFYKAATILKFKMMKHLKKDITLMRINTGGKVTNSPTSFHIDYEDPFYYTLVLFTRMSWDTQWGGELVAQNPDTKEYHYHSYIPNHAVFFPSNWQHCGFAPNNSTSKMRTVVAFSYVETDHIKDMSEERKQFARKFGFPY